VHAAGVVDDASVLSKATSGALVKKLNNIEVRVPPTNQNSKHKETQEKHPWVEVGHHFALLSYC
jgi:hypothetical protein